MIFNFLNNYKGIAIICKEKESSFEELYLRILFYKNKLKNYSNEIIAIKGDFDFETISLFFAISTTNNVAVPLVQTTDDEIKNKIYTSKVSIIFRYNEIGDKLLAEKLNVEKNKELKSGIILFSSGTTGLPKMMFHEFSKLMKINEADTRRQRNINVLLFLMFDHIGGINTLLNCIKDGSTIIIPKTRKPDYVIELISKYKVNVLPTTPTFLNLMLIDLENNYEKLKSLKLITYGTERMPEQVLINLKNNLPNIKLLQTFGTSETGILKTISKSSNSLYFKIEDDRYEYKIVENVLLIKSILNVQGYLNQESDKFDKDGWYNTGDIVKIDEDGFIMVVGRINEIINIGGLKVMPTEIEKILLEFNGIEDCVVYGEFNALTGQMVAAKIVLSEHFFFDLNHIEIKKLIKNHCFSKLDKYKVPVKIYFVNKIEISNRFKKVIK